MEMDMVEPQDGAGVVPSSRRLHKPREELGPCQQLQLLSSCNSQLGLTTASEGW